MIRHGLPERVVRDDGAPADPPLAAEGWEQARRMARWLARERIERVYASPMQRARQTAEPLVEALADITEAEIVPGVAEFDRDASHYIPLEQLREEDYARWRQLMESGWYSELDPEHFTERVVQAVEGIIADNPGRKVAVVCHGGVVNVWAAHLLGLSTPLFFAPEYTSISRFRASAKGHRSVVSLNEAGHLVVDLPPRGA